MENSKNVRKYVEAGKGIWGKGRNEAKAIKGNCVKVERQEKARVYGKSVQRQVRSCSR